MICQPGMPPVVITRVTVAGVAGPGPYDPPGDGTGLANAPGTAAAEAGRPPQMIATRTAVRWPRWARAVRVTLCGGVPWRDGCVVMVFPLLRGVRLAIPALTG